MPNIFQQIPLKRRSLFQVLFNQHPDENAVISVNNLLASRKIREVRKLDIQAIEGKYGISLTEEFPLNLEEFYAVYLNQAIRNQYLSDDESDNLAHLRELLSLDQKSVYELHQLIGTSVYREVFQESIRDGVIDDSERNKLNALFEKLNLPESAIQTIENTAKAGYVDHQAQVLVDRLQFSPDDEGQLKRLADNLGVEFKPGAGLRKQIDRLKSYWTLENNPLQPINVDADLQKAEVCFMFVPGVKWFDLKTGSVAPHVRLEESVRLTKRTFVSNESTRPVRFAASEMKLIQTGTVYLTNKRILMAGNIKNANIRLEKIMDFIPFEDSAEIRKDSGKNPLLVFPRNGDLFCLTLARLLKNTRGD